MILPKSLANALRVLSVDAIEHANSGHPGMPLGMADIAQQLWMCFMRHNPNNPDWINRDRFVLSNGHGSMLLYSILHLTGYSISIEDIKMFRQLHSKTPGHPEIETVGVETTTGPLGQGLANAVGMAIAEKLLAIQFNRDQFNIIDHYTYVFVGDGCLMEGISHEVCSLAGLLGLGKLIVFWDNNGISIDGEISGWYGDNTAKRFEAYGWHVITDIDGHDADSINSAITQARADKNAPSLLCCKTIIGFGAPNKAGTAASHGAPLGAEETRLLRKKLQWDCDPFFIPDEITVAWDNRDEGSRLEQEWNCKFEEYANRYPNNAKELRRRIAGDLPSAITQKIDSIISKFINKPEIMATRKASQIVLEEIAGSMPELIGGSADLTTSNLNQLVSE